MVPFLLCFPPSVIALPFMIAVSIRVHPVNCCKCERCVSILLSIDFLHYAGESLAQMTREPAGAEGASPANDDDGTATTCARVQKQSRQKRIVMVRMLLV